jgi:hypothetical protein
VTPDCITAAERFCATLPFFPFALAGLFTLSVLFEAVIRWLEDRNT